MYEFLGLLAIAVMLAIAVAVLWQPCQRIIQEAKMCRFLKKVCGIKLAPNQALDSVAVWFLNSRPELELTSLSLADFLELFRANQRMKEGVIPKTFLVRVGKRPATMEAEGYLGDNHSYHLVSEWWKMSPEDFGLIHDWATLTDHAGQHCLLKLYVKSPNYDLLQLVLWVATTFPDNGSFECEKGTYKGVADIANTRDAIPSLNLMGIRKQLEVYCPNFRQYPGLVNALYPHGIPTQEEGKKDGNRD